MKRGEVTVGRKGTDTSQDGFSMIELVIAMTVTLIISAAIFQLVTAGQSAFRKEPAMADRQQSIRMAMDIISQDVYRAGYGLPQFAQAFTDGLDGIGPLGPGGVNTDELETFSATECPVLGVCGASGVQATTFQLLSPCYQFPALVILGDASCWGMRWAEKPGSGTSSSCPSAPPGTKNGHVNFPPGQAPLVNPPGGFTGWTPEWMLVGQAIRYRINIDADGTPNLERSTAGGGNIPGPGGGSSSWQVLASGVEDLQVEYLNAAGWQDQPGAISCATATTACGDTCQAAASDFDTLIRRVRITLSARALAANLTGQTTSAVGNAPRGQLITEVAPRPAQATLSAQAGEI
ncbi:MAG: prepilin-type N-terminal cleavage/methylation domain-containing protein [Acidobacteriota bacterium]|jgi:prepilin-type N-terminal cleavage/methylation domain-containing protein